MFTWPADQLPTVQISLDLEDLDDVLRVAEIALEAGVDWIEAGTPVFAVNGMAGLRALRSEFPEAFIVADMKVIDGGAYFANMVADNGGNAIDIMAAAADPVLTGAVEVGPGCCGTAVELHHCPGCCPGAALPGGRVGDVSVWLKGLAFFGSL